MNSKFAVSILWAALAFGQEAGLRPPATPLVAFDPYFSIWSMSDKLTDTNTRHWTGTEQALSGLIRIDGKSYRFMGTRPRRSVPALPQMAVQVLPTHTIYTFGGDGIRLVFTFFSPSFPGDIEVMARPVAYLRWDVSSTDGAKHAVSLLLDCDPAVAVDQNAQEVTWSRAQAGPLAVLSVGSRDQRVLERSGDDLRRDWGYFHLAVPAGEQAALANSKEAVSSFAASGSLPDEDDLEMPQPARAAAHLAAMFSVDVDAARTQSRHLLLAYTEPFSIEYLNERLRPYWRRNGDGRGAVCGSGETRPAI